MPALELLVAIMRKPHRAAGKEHARQRDIERERRVVAATESATHMGKVRVDPRRLERAVRLAEEMRDQLRGLVGRLRAQHDLEIPAARVEPGEPGFRLQKHRIDGLGLEFAIQYQQVGIVRCELCANPLAIGRRFDIRRAFGDGQHPPDRPSVVVKARTDPAFLDWRIDVGSVRAGPGHARKAKRAIVRLRDRAGVLAELHECAVAELEPRLVEGVERLEDQQCDRLTHVHWRLADRAEQVAGVELGHAGAGFREILRGHHHRRPQRAVQARKVHAGVDARGVRRADQQGMRCLRRPSGKIGGAEIRSVKLGPGDLGDAVNAADAGRGRIPSLPGRQRLRWPRTGLPRAAPRRDRLSAIPLAVTHVTNSRREGRMLTPPSALSLKPRYKRHRCADDTSIRREAQFELVTNNSDQAPQYASE